MTLYLGRTAVNATLAVGGKVNDVQVDGVSVVTNKVAEIDLTGKQDVISDLSTIRSGASAGATAVQPSDLATVATSGSYNDLDDKPTIPAAQVNSDWNSSSGVSQILNKPTLGTMAAENTTSYYTKTELDGKLNSAMHFKGTKARVADLPSSGQEVGDMWNVQSTGANYAWDGSSWDKLSENIDLSGLQPNLTSSNAGTGISITGSGSNVVISNTQTSAEWGNVTGTLSNQTDLQTALGNKANDVDVVKLTGNQTISGIKTFNDGMFTKNIIPKGYITLGTSTNTWGHMVQFQDTAGKRIARVQPMAIDTTKNRMGMWVNNADNTVEQGIEIWSDGTTVAPTPATSDNSTKIATTAFVVNVLKAIYPVGAVYIGTTSTCPLASFFGTWTLKSTGVVTNVNSTVAVAGNGKALGLIGNKSNGDVVTVSLMADSVGGLHSSTTAPESQIIDNNPSPLYNSWGVKNGSGFGVSTNTTKSGLTGTLTRSTLSVNIWERTA